MSKQSLLEESQSLLPPPYSLTTILYPRKRKYPACPLCKINFLKESELKHHLGEDQWAKYISNTHENDYRCDECCIFFESEKGYMQHCGKVHETKYKYSKCTLCKKKFKNKYAVKFHMKQVHQKTTRKKCPNCGKEFYNKYLIPHHLQKCNKMQKKDIELSLESE